MANEKSIRTFAAAMSKASPASTRAPINVRALHQDAAISLDRIANLIGYRDYLARSRSWKAERSNTPSSFEREVRDHAARALADGRDVVAAALRATRHRKRAGRLDHALDGWIAGIEASGPIDVNDLWRSLAHDATSRDVLRANGMSDELFAAVDDGMREFGGRISIKGGELHAELHLSNQSEVHPVTIAHTATGAPRSVDDLLRRGHFEQAVADFERHGKLAVGTRIGASGDVDVSSIVLASMGAGMAFLGQHHRNLEDTGLATYSGNGPALGIIFLAGLIAFIVGSILEHWCDEDGDGGTACTIGKILTLVGLLAMAVTAIIAGDVAFGALLGVFFLYDLLKELGLNVELYEIEEDGF